MSIIVALVVFSLLVTVHEFGHYIVAKKSDVKVEEFAIGMGPKILSKKVGETEYTLRILPLGGFCSMLGEEESSNEDRAFCNKKVGPRMAIIVAGAFMNFIYALVAVVIVALMIPVDTTVVHSVVKDSKAEEAGLMPNDKIVMINNKEITLYDQIKYQMFFVNRDQEYIDMQVERDGEMYNLKSHFDTVLKVSEIPKEVSKDYPVMQDDLIIKINGKEIREFENIGEFAEKNKTVDLTIRRGNNFIDVDSINSQVLVINQNLKDNLLGFSVKQEKLNILGTFDYSVKKFKFFISSTLSGLKMLISKQMSFKQMSGPVGIVRMMGNRYEQSIQLNETFGDKFKSVLVNMLMFSALLSANLGLINLMPFPALDGGRFVFLFIEMLRGKPIKTEYENWVHVIGFSLLMLLMVVVFYTDIVKLVKGII